MTDQRIYHYVTKLESLFQDVRNDIDSITSFIAKSSGWEYADVFSKFYVSEYDETKFIIMMYLHRIGLSYDEIISKMKNTSVIVLVTDNEEAIEADCYDCGGSGEFDCDECDNNSTVECSLCDGSGQESNGEECERCGGTGSHECQSCGGDGTVTCQTCNGDGTLVDYDKTNITLYTYLTFNPVVTNYFRKHYKETISDINESIEEELILVSEDEFTVELQSRFERITNYVIEVSSNPETIMSLVTDPSYKLENEYVWNLTR